MHEPTALVTGSCGLIGSEVTLRLAGSGWTVTGVDNLFRSIFFGEEGDTRWMLDRLERQAPRYHHAAIDVRDRSAMLNLVAGTRPALIVHAAAQPSHDKAASIPFVDFEVNALGTLHLLEAARRFCPESPFIFFSTNKVYGDGPNTVPLRELETRWDYAGEQYAEGIAEDFPVDQCLHSLFGASKLAADVLVQEYGRYFQMPTCCLRAGCLTGPNQSGVELHGFLNYLVKCAVEGRPYRIYGYKGKQVRDNIHAADVAAFVEAFAARPRVAEVYNLGGGRANSCSVLEAIQLAEAAAGRRLAWEYVAEARKGDHICYISNLGKLHAHFPEWKISKGLGAIVEEIAAGWLGRSRGAAV